MFSHKLSQTLPRKWKGKKRYALNNAVNYLSKYQDYINYDEILLIEYVDM